MRRGSCLAERVGECARVRNDAIKMGSCNCPSFEEWYGGEGHRVPAQHLGAILRRINYINLHEFELSSGEVVDLCCPVMTNDEKGTL